MAGDKRLARHNVVGVFAGLRRAAAAVDRLTSTGVPHGEVSLLGPHHEMRPGSGKLSETPATGSSGLGTGLLRGAGVGTAVGGAVGLLAGVAVAALPGVGLTVGAGALYATIAGAATGQIAGGLLGGEAAARKSMMWAQGLQPLLTLVEEADRVLVGVHTDDAARADDAQEQLEGLHPERVERLEAERGYHPPGDREALVGHTVPSSAPDAPGVGTRAEIPSQ